ncbi:MAG: Gfo/Idh/MocA family oxidoreductase [Planctomycetes bacterium]|nr:Gfo/Idh/MocA family oxidoreductase [Planctomycetota bacterium]
MGMERTTGTGATRREFLAAGAGAIGAALAEARAPEGVRPPIRFGVIGAGGRGTHLLRLLLGFEEVAVTAVCDIAEANLDRALEAVRAAKGKRPAGYGGGPLDYRNLLERADVDAVLVATPMPLHGPMSIDALRAGKHVLSEVAAAMTIEECWGLVEAAEASGRTYMLSENCCYWEFVLAILGMVRAGVFGDPTYAECGYVHDCRPIKFERDGSLTWRGEMSRDFSGNLYPTHSLGPVATWLGINRGDRMERLVALDTRQASLVRYARERFGADHAAARVAFRVGDSTSALIRTAKGVVIDLRYDTCSARPHPSTTYYALQGLRASYDSRIDGIWIEGKSKGYAWEPFGTHAKAFEPPIWKAFREKAKDSGHAGGDYLVLRAFVDALLEGKPAPVDVYDAAAWSAVIPLSAASIRGGGEPQEIPDFTRGRWKDRGRA